MNHHEQALIDFLQWLEQSKFVPTNVKYNFIKYISTSQRLDAKSINFIKSILELASQKQANARNVLSDEWTQLNTSLQIQKQPDQALSYKIAKQAKRRMTGTVRTFKKKYLQQQSQKSKQEESLEHQSNLDQIAALKAAL